MTAKFTKISLKKSFEMFVENGERKKRRVGEEGAGKVCGYFNLFYF